LIKIKAAAHPTVKLVMPSCRQDGRHRRCLGLSTRTPVMASDTAGQSDRRAMPNGREEPPAGRPDRPPVRYTCFFLELNGHWSDAKRIYAVDDAEAVGIATSMADNRPFELWEAFRFVHWPTQDLH
jgi:hypothetical protein